MDHAGLSTTTTVRGHQPSKHRPSNTTATYSFSSLLFTSRLSSSPATTSGGGPPIPMYVSSLRPLLCSADFCRAERDMMAAAALARRKWGGGRVSCCSCSYSCSLPPARGACFPACLCVVVFGGCPRVRGFWMHSMMHDPMVPFRRSSLSQPTDRSTATATTPRSIQQV